MSSGRGPSYSVVHSSPSFNGARSLPNIFPHGTSGSAAGGLDDDVDELSELEELFDDELKLDELEELFDDELTLDVLEEEELFDEKLTLEELDELFEDELTLEEEDAC